MDIQSIISLGLFVVFLLFITLIGFPISFLLFRKSIGRGFAFTKISIIITLSFTSWIIGHIGHYYTFPVIFTIFVSISVVSGIIYQKQKNNIHTFLASHKKLLIFEETVFWVFFTLLLIIRIGNPDLWHPTMGGEKPMDFAFINAMTRATSLPPFDPWFGGATINYYYFGQFMTATISKLLGVPPAIFYNLFLTFIFAQSAVGIASIVFSFTKSKTFSTLGSILLLISGNLAQIPVIVHSLKASIPINGWYWTATRVMPNSEINEFPFFSFLYADLHAHLIDLPVSLLVIALLMEIRQLIISRAINSAIIISLVTAFIMGIIRITNIWDYPTFLLFSLIVVSLTTVFGLKASILKRLIFTGALSLIFIIGSNTSILPFLISYKTGPLGISIYNGPSTRISDYLLIHGLFLSFLTAFVLFLKPWQLPHASHVIKMLAYIMLAVVVLFIVVTFKFLVFLLLLIILILLVLITNKKQDILSGAGFFIFALFLTAIPDIVDIKLGLGRMNAVFKFYFQAWIFFSIGSAIVSYYIFQYTKKGKIIRAILVGTFLIIIAVTLSYPLTATPAKIADRMGKRKMPTLDGAYYMKSSVYYDQGKELVLAYDLEAIEWINTSIRDAPVILEASTPIYRWGSRISVYTGLPTVIGWDWHEKAHRSYLSPVIVDTRVSDVKRLYNTTSLEEFIDLINRYNIQYIYVGELEKAYYDTNGFIKFDNLKGYLTQEVYRNPGVTIYKIIHSKRLGV